MKNGKLFVTAIVLSGSFIIGCSSSDRGSASRSTSAGSSASRATGSGGSTSSAATSSQQRTSANISQADMRKVEEALKAKGFDPGTIDGQMDAKTQQALRDYQSKNKLPVTGTVDKATADSLGVSIASQSDRSPSARPQPERSQSEKSNPPSKAY
jgi:peptidoglycan hydrolase-like protein with peptidoglycan-binding domain